MKRPALRPFWLSAIFSATFLVACDEAASADDDRDVGSGGAGGAVPSSVTAAGGGGASADACDGAPLVTWASFGEAFATRYCRGCHSAGAADRHDAPPGLDFDDKAIFLAYADSVMERVGSPSDGSLQVEPAAGPMPPGGGVSEDDRTLLSIWLECWREEDAAAAE